MFQAYILSFKTMISSSYLLLTLWIMIFTNWKPVVLIVLCEWHCLLGSGRAGVLCRVWRSWRRGRCHLCCQPPPRQLSSPGIIQPGPKRGALQSLQSHWWGLREEGKTGGKHIHKLPNLFIKIHKRQTCKLYEVFLYYVNWKCVYFFYYCWCF